MSDELTIHIYPSDCDTAGHVNHTYMLHGRTIFSAWP